MGENQNELYVTLKQLAWAEGRQNRWYVLRDVGTAGMCWGTPEQLACAEIWIAAIS